MFVPVVLMENSEKATFEDGRPLIKSTRILNPGKDSAVLPPTPWFLSPLFWSWLIALFIGVMVCHNILIHRLTLSLYVVWFFILGLAGCLIAFLVFISVHESTSPNILIFWLNPFQFLFAFSIGIKKLRSIASAMAYYNIVAVGILLILSPFITQSFNPAFFPLMLATLGLAAGYAIIGNKSSYRSI